MATRACCAAHDSVGIHAAQGLMSNKDYVKKREEVARPDEQVRARSS